MGSEPAIDITHAPAGSDTLRGLVGKLVWSGTSQLWVKVGKEEGRYHVSIKLGIQRASERGCCLSIKGIFELMARGDYPLTTVGWLMVEDRLNLFDFIPIRYENRILAMKEAKISIDHGLFARPFRLELWLATGLFFILIFAILLALHLKMKGTQVRNGKKSFMMVGWMILLFLDAYYSRALTMYFIGSPGLPFN